MLIFGHNYVAIQQDMLLLVSCHTSVISHMANAPPSSSSSPPFPPPPSLLSPPPPPSSPCPPPPLPPHPPLPPPPPLASSPHLFQCVAYIAAAELPAGQWPDIITNLLRNVSGPSSTEAVKEASLETIGYICEELVSGYLSTLSL